MTGDPRVRVDASIVVVEPRLARGLFDTNDQQSVSAWCVPWRELCAKLMSLD